jgi:hypothetical protein
LNNYLRSIMPSPCYHTIMQHMLKFHMSDTQWNTFSCKTSLKEMVCRKNEIPGIISGCYRSKQYSCLYNFNKWKHWDVTQHGRRESKWKLFTASKLDKTGDSLSYSPQNFPKYVANDTMIWKCHKTPDTYHIRQEQAAGL